MINFSLIVFVNVLSFCLPDIVDCDVSEWTTWSIPDDGGNTMRSRVIIQPALNNGKPCPPLTENDQGKK